jgi:PPP family 3-phenylpropionic acid transporter
MALAALVALGLLRAAGFSALLMVSVVHAAALAPITTLADALALRAAAWRDPVTRFEYGWVREQAPNLHDLDDGETCSRRQSGGDRARA